MLRKQPADLFCDGSMHRKRLLGDVIMLPPLVTSPGMTSAPNLSENDDPPADAVVDVDEEV